MLERIRKGREKLKKLSRISTLTSRHIRRSMRARAKDAARMLKPLEAFISRHNEESLRRHLAESCHRPASDNPVNPTRILRWIASGLAALAVSAALAGIWWVSAMAGLIFRPSFSRTFRRGSSGSDASAGEYGAAEVLLDVYQHDSVNSCR